MGKRMKTYIPAYLPLVLFFTSMPPQRDGSGESKLFTTPRGSASMAVRRYRCTVSTQVPVRAVCTHRCAILPMPGIWLKHLKNKPEWSTHTRPFRHTVYTRHRQNFTPVRANFQQIYFNEFEFFAPQNINKIKIILAKPKKV